MHIITESLAQIFPSHKHILLLHILQSKYWTVRLHLFQNKDRIFESRILGTGVHPYSENVRLVIWRVAIYVYYTYKLNASVHKYHTSTQVSYEMTWHCHVLLCASYGKDVVSSKWSERLLLKCCWGILERDRQQLRAHAYDDENVVDEAIAANKWQQDDHKITRGVRWSDWYDIITEIFHTPTTLS